MAGTALAWSIFHIAQSKILAFRCTQWLYFQHHVILIWSKECNYRWWLALMFFMVLFCFSWSLINFTPPRCFYFQSVHVQKCSLTWRALIPQAIIPVWPHKITKNVHLGESNMRNMADFITMFCLDAAFCYIYVCMKAEQEKYSV